MDFPFDDFRTEKMRSQRRERDRKSGKTKPTPKPKTPQGTTLNPAAEARTKEARAFLELPPNLVPAPVVKPPAPVLHLDDHLPLLKCAVCIIREQCDKFRPEPEALCEYKYTVEDVKDMDALDMMKEIVRVDFARTKRLLHIERANGFIADRETSARLDATYDKLDRLRGRSSGDAMEIPKGGLIAAIFADLGGQEEKPKVIDAKEVKK